MIEKDGKVILHAVHSDDLEGVLRKIGSYEAIKGDKMTCHFCYGPIDTYNMSALVRTPRGVAYACGDFGCYREAVSHRESE